VIAPASPLRTLAEARALPRVRLRWLVFALVAAFGLRLCLVWQRATPNYFPDEYLYAALGRALAAVGAPTIRGHSAHFPELLQPLLTAPAWRAGSLLTGYRIVQAIEAAALTLAAIPAYVLARKVHPSQWVAIAAAALALVVPDGLYASMVVAEPIAYPLVLAAVAAGICALARPSLRSQLAFLAFAGLATFARAQFAILPLCFIAAAAIVAVREREPRRILREQRLVLFASGVALIVVLVTGPHRIVGYYSEAFDPHVHPIAMAQSIGANLMVLAYAAGWVLVPGAILGVYGSVAKPRSRTELAFGALAFALAVGLLLEAALYGDTVLIQERYLFYVIPLMPVAFGLYATRGLPHRTALLGIAAVLLAVSARLPLSHWAQPGVDDHSTFLLGVQQLERIFGGNAAGAEAVAVAAAVLMLVAIGVSFVPRAATAIVLSLSVVAAGAMFLCAFEFDRLNSDVLRHLDLPANRSWVDAARVGKATLVVSPGGRVTDADEQLFWNRSIDSVGVLPGGVAPDKLASQPISFTKDGSLIEPGGVLRGPLVVDGYASTVTLRHGRVVSRSPHFALVVPDGGAQLSSLMWGRYWDGRLLGSGGIALWPAHGGGHLAGWLVLNVTGAHFGPLDMTLRTPNGKRRLIHAAANTPVSARVRICSDGPWFATFTAPSRDIDDGRLVSGQSSPPRFVADAGACTHGGA